MSQQAHIRGTLNIGGAAQSVDAAAANTHVRQQQLEDGVAADVLGAVGVLGGAHGIHDGARLALLTGSRVGLADLKVNILRRAGDVANGIRIVAGKVLLQ